MSESATVFIVEDDTASRYALQRRLEAAGLDVEAFANGEEFLAASVADRPGCLVLDLRLEGLDGLALQERLTAQGTMLSIILLTAFGTVPAAVEAMKRGAFDFLTKPYSDEVLLERVRAGLAESQRRHEFQQRRTAYQERLARLTAREAQILDLVVIGRSNKEIAGQLGISTKTVEAHRAKIMLKTQADSVVELLRIVDTQKHGHGFSVTCDGL